MDKVLVTGISGFLGGHVARTLLEHGYQVRGTLRDIERSHAVRTALTRAGADIGGLEFVELDLLDDHGWTEAVQGCRFVQHIASPFLLTMPKDAQELIRPAVEGTQRIVTAALKQGAERIILTSSLAAIDGGHDDYDVLFDETIWTNIAGPYVSAYARSKTIAEQAAWDIVQQAGQDTRLAVINPGTMLGPLLDEDVGTSARIVQQLLEGAMPMLPDLILPYVDVRDVADAQVAAMTATNASGKRHIITNASMSLPVLAQMLNEEFAPEGRSIKIRPMPTWLAKLLAHFDASLKGSRTYLGVQRRYDGHRGEQLLGRPLRTTKEAVLATAASLARLSSDI